MYNRIKIVDLEINTNIPEITNLDEYDSLQIIVFQGTAILGRLDFNTRNIAKIASHKISAAINGFMSTHDLKNQVFANPIQKSNMGKYSKSKFTDLISIAICTKDRDESLQLCLQSIKNLNYSNLEIIVIDNASETDTTKNLVITKFPGVKYYYEPKPGLNWARNRAINEASGKIIAFTDDDAIVDPNWINYLLSGFNSDLEICCTTGLVLPSKLETKAQILFEKYGGFGKGFESQIFQKKQTGLKKYKHLDTGQYGTGANMAFRKDVFTKIGLFDPAFDVGTKTRGGGDLEIFFRILQHNYKLAYIPSAIVRHSHRETEEELFYQIESWGVSCISFIIKGILKYPGIRIAFFLFLLYWFGQRHVLRILKLLFTLDIQILKLALLEIKGFILGIFAYNKSKLIAREIETNAYM